MSFFELRRAMVSIKPNAYSTLTGLMNQLEVLDVRDGRTEVNLRMGPLGYEPEGRIAASVAFPRAA
jgi:hypothetical protein